MIIVRQAQDTIDSLTTLDRMLYDAAKEEFEKVLPRPVLSCSILYCTSTIQQSKFHGVAKDASIRSLRRRTTLTPFERAVHDPDFRGTATLPCCATCIERWLYSARYYR